MTGSWEKFLAFPMTEIGFNNSTGIDRHSLTSAIRRDASFVALMTCQMLPRSQSICLSLTWPLS